MKVKARVSFAGVAISMVKNEIRDCGETAALASLLAAGYVEEVKPVAEKAEKPANKKKTVKEV